MPRANWNFIGNCLLPVPPLPEQIAIADFLDRETGRIDTLVAKKRRLIALLGEKRTALISRTVTRGLPAEAAREFGLEPHTRLQEYRTALITAAVTGKIDVRGKADKQGRTRTNKDWTDRQQRGEAHQKARWKKNL